MKIEIVPTIVAILAIDPSDILFHLLNLEDLGRDEWGLEIF